MEDKYKEYMDLVMIRLVVEGKEVAVVGLPKDTLADLNPVNPIQARQQAKEILLGELRAQLDSHLVYHTNGVMH